MKSNLRFAAFLIVTIAAFSTFVTAKESRRRSCITTDARTVSLLKAISKDFDFQDYMIVSIETTRYLLKNGKVLRTKRVKRTGGFCGGYAAVDTNLSNLKMEELAQGGSSVWKKSGQTWKRVASNEGDWQCADIKPIPRTVRRCLRITDCN